MDSGATAPVPNPPGKILSQPSWSPDNSRLATSSLTAGVHNGIYTLKPDGSEATEVQAQGFQPSWSPDGSRIALVEGSGNDRDIYTVRPDGTGKQLLTADVAAYVNGYPAWQPIPVNSYPRPKAATPLEMTLVPAYTPCTSPNRIHGPPLVFDSCNPPAKASDELTLGTPDANGKPVKGEGLVRYAAVNGDPTTTGDEADVQIFVELKDVYEHSTLTDYSGELRLRTGLRVTDKLNTPHPGGPGAATVSDTTLGTTVPCTPTGDPGTGASCFLITSADALAPGSVIERKRSVWELGQVQVDDGGADGDADTPADNTLFMVQGLFVP
jgi:hypothetical protein